MRTEREKLAFIGGLYRAARRFAPQAGAKFFGPMLNKAMGGNAGTALGKRVGREIFTQGLGGAAIGGVLEGGLGAAMADDGHRGEAFARGALHGTAIGAAGGAISGAVTPFSRMARFKAMRAAGATPMQAGRTLKRNWFGNVWDVARGNGPGGRIPAAIEAAAVPAEFLAVNALMPGGEAPAPAPTAQAAPPQPQPPHTYPGQVRTASEHEGFYGGDLADLSGFPGDDRRGPSVQLDPLYITPFSSALGAGLADAGVKKYAPKMPDNFFRRRGVPALGAAAVTIPSVLAIRALQPKPENPLEDIDVDALKYYFGKKPPAANP
jgi:hypothetical protein